jgi:hypothetical protein
MPGVLALAPSVIAFYTVTPGESQLLQLLTATGYGLGMSQVAAGPSLAPMGVAMKLAAPLSARITPRTGPTPASLCVTAWRAGG